MAKVDYYLSNKVTQAGTAQVLLYFSYDGNRLVIATDVYVPAKINDNSERVSKAWNVRAKDYKHIGSSYKNAALINQKLKKWAGDIDDAYLKLQLGGQAIEKESFKNRIREILNPNLVINKSTPSFTGFIDSFVKSHALNANTKKGYVSTYNVLIEFEKKYRRGRSLQFNDIDIEFYNDFTEYLFEKRDKKLNKNSVGSHIKCIKKFMNEAFEIGLTDNIKFKSKKFKMLNEDVDAIYLNNQELQHLAGLDLADNKKLDQVRDRFLISCYTGLRFSDLQRLTPDHIHGNFIRIKTQKTDQDVTIPIHPVVRKIIDKYNYSWPPAISNQKFNEYLKDLGKDKAKFESMVTTSYSTGNTRVYKNSPKWGLITSHTARRSFATNAYLDGVPSLLIMAITGHRTERSFLKYIKVTNDEHAAKLLSLWNDKARAELKAV
jgi:integrase